nr:hypothetical protein [Cystobacter fuscus]
MLSTLQSWVYRRRRQEGAPVAQPVRLLPVQVTAEQDVARVDRPRAWTPARQPSEEVTSQKLPPQ